MGNIVHGAGLLSNVQHFPYHLKLGTYATIDVTKDEGEIELVEEEHGGVQSVHYVRWNVSYTIDGSTCKLQLTINSGKDRKVNNILFSILDDIFKGGGFRLRIVRKAETNLLQKSGVSCYPRFGCLPQNKTKTTTVHAGGSVTHTNVYVYGSGSKGGLVVFEWKIKSGDGNAYMWTVAHYYAASNGNFFDQTRMDIGLSVIVKALASNDKGMDVTVEGPVQHPAAALFYMFDEVKRSGTWKPTSCPHCASIQRQQRRGIMFWQSESEDSDGSLPPARLHGPRSNGGGCVIANDGAVRGNNNGSLLVNRINRLFLR